VLEYVNDLDDPRLTDYTGLRDVELRKSLEAERGLFLAEGEKVIKRAIAAGHPVRSVLTTERWLRTLDEVPTEATVYVVDDEVMSGIAGFQVHRGALASMERLELPSVAEVIEKARRIVVLEDIVDHTNVGALFRSAAALGVDAVVLSPRCADPLYRRAVKVSMGAVFAAPYARIDDWFDGLTQLRAAGFQTLALTPAADAVPLREVALGERAALLLGSEGHGLSSRWLHEADQAVRIPMDPGALARGVDSLNVVAAAAIACYELVTSRD
jgi:tRNA G18 (ribose-2'-O)-methylase SpoU